MAHALDDEARLVEFAVAGDFDSFAALYSHHMDAIYRYAFFRMGNQQDAEDLTEQAFLRAWEAMPSFRSIGCSFLHWMYRIAHNLVVDYHRHGARVIEESLPNQLTLTLDEVPVIDYMLRVEEITTLAGAIRQLSDEQQQVIILRFIEGFSHAEISRILQKSEMACRAIQHRALVILNHKLAPGSEAE